MGNVVSASRSQGIPRFGVALSGFLTAVCALWTPCPAGAVSSEETIDWQGNHVEGDWVLGTGSARETDENESVRRAFLDALGNLTHVLNEYVAVMVKITPDQTVTTLKSLGAAELIPGVRCAHLQKQYSSSINLRTTLGHSATEIQFHTVREDLTTVKRDRQVIQEMSIGTTAEIEIDVPEEGHYESTTRCVVESSQSLLELIPIHSKVIVKELDGSEVTTVQVRVPLSTARSIGEARDLESGVVTEPAGKHPHAETGHISEMNRVWTPGPCPGLEKLAGVGQVPSWLVGGLGDPQQSQRLGVNTAVGSAPPLLNLGLQRKAAEADARARLAMKKRNVRGDENVGTFEWWGGGINIIDYWVATCSGIAYALAQER